MKKFYIYKVVTEVSFGITYEAKIKMFEYVVEEKAIRAIATCVLDDLYENILFPGYKVTSRSCYEKHEDGRIAKDSATLKFIPTNRFEPEKTIRVNFEVWDKELGEEEGELEC